MPGDRRVPWTALAAVTPFALVLFAFVALLNLKATQHDDAATHSEPVRVRVIGGASYTLFFHRAKGHFNTVEKDGQRVFDGRRVDGSAGCVWELLDRGGVPVVRCYLAGGEPEIREVTLP